MQRCCLPAGYHRGARADAYYIGCGGAFLEAADEHGDIRALTTAIGVQFVEDKISQSVRPGGGEQALIIWTHEQQFRHDVVGEQDLRRVGLHLAPGVALHVAGVFGEADGKTSARARFVAAF